VILQLLTEGLVLACAAGLLGLAVARVALEAALAVMVTTTPPAAHVMLEMLTPDLSLDWRVFFLRDDADVGDHVRGQPRSCGPSHAG
jgi:hypothetical protein